MNTNFKQVAAVAFAGAALTLSAPLAAQNLVGNGSFETPNAAPAPGYVGPLGPVAPWVGNNVDVVSNTFFGAGFAKAGSQTLDLVGEGSAGSIYQDIATVVGQIYSFSFAYSNNFAGSGSPANATVVASVGNVLTTPGLTHTNASSGNGNWLVYSNTFTANSALTRLTFTGTGANNAGIVIDDVQISAAPEPAVWGMLILGFGMAGVALRTRRRSVAVV